jgi:hypothetical protein
LAPITVKGLVMHHVYFSALFETARLAAELAVGEGEPAIYIVEPSGDFEDDPNVTDKKFPGNPTRSFRSTAPLKVIEELKNWERLDAETVKKWKENIERLKNDPNTEIIN